MYLLKQSTASQEVPLGYFLDSTDGNTEETGLTIANTDIKLHKAGATTLANKNSGGATHISNGIYYAVLDATDTDTLGSLVIFVHVSGALCVRLECLVLPADVYDAIVSASGNGIRAAVQTFAAGAITAAAVATGAIDADALATDAVNEIADGIMTRASSNWEASAPVKSLGVAVMKATHRTRDNAGTLEVYRSDNTTVHSSQAITTDAANLPIDELGGST